MSKYSKIFIFLIVSGLSFSSKAQFNYSINAQNAHSAILDLNFERYNALRNLQNANDKAVFFWLDGYKNFVYYITSSKKSNPDSLINQLQHNISSLTSFSNRHPFYNYTLTDLNLFLSYIYLDENKPILALQHYLKAKSILNSSAKKYPDFEFGGKHALVGFIINHQISQQFGLKTPSNIELQTAYIHLYEKHSITANQTYNRELKLLTILLFDLQFDSDATLFIQKLDLSMEYAKTGPIEAFASALWYKKAENYPVQLSILQHAHELGFTKHYNLLNLWYGIALLNNQNDSAIYFIDAFTYRQQNLKGIQYASFKASMYWFLKGNTAKSNRLNQNILKSAEFYSSEDKQARYEIEHAEFWTKELVEARLLFDGGNYKKSLEVLLSARAKVSSYTNEQKLEYGYRIARIYDKFKDVEKAAKFYLMVINSDLDSRFYYPAYAAFYLGNLYAERNESDKAKTYYSKCIELDSPIYKASIHKKAKMAMQL